MSEGGGGVDAPGQTTVEFSNYRADGGGAAPAPITVGSNPWGDSDPATYTENFIYRAAINSAGGYAHFADVTADIPLGATITDLSIETDLVATNGGAAPGSALFSAFIFYGPPSGPTIHDGDLAGWFNNYPGGAIGSAPSGIVGSGDNLTGTWLDYNYSGGTPDLSTIMMAVNNGGYIEVRRFDNFVPPYSGNYTLRCKRILVTISYTVPEVAGRLKVWTGSEWANATYRTGD